MSIMLATVSIPMPIAIAKNEAKLRLRMMMKLTERQYCISRARQGLRRTITRPAVSQNISSDSSSIKARHHSFPFLSSNFCAVGNGSLS